MSDYFNLNEEIKKTEKHFPKLKNYLNKKYIFPALILLAIPLTVSLALVTQEIRSRASEYPATPPIPATSTSPNPTPLSYTLVPYPIQNVTMPVSQPNTGYAVQALLKNKDGSVVTNQSDFTYKWTKDDPSNVLNILSPFSACSYGITEPCPYDHASFKGLKPGNAKVMATVTQNSTGNEVASVTFSVNVQSPTPTPKPTVISTPTPTKKLTPTPTSKVVCKSGYVICPNGTRVFRKPPSCQFPACPKPTGAM